MTNLITAHRREPLSDHASGATILDDLYFRFERRPERVAFTSAAGVWTYRRLVADAEHLARALVVQGVQPGARVALHMANVPELVIAYYACFQIGAIAVPLNTRLKTPELRALLKRLRPALYLGQAALYPLVASIEPELLATESRFVSDSDRVDGAQSWDRLLASAPARTTHRSSDLDAPAVLLATSGTTGEPKLVTQTLATLTALAEGLRGFRITENENTIVALPMVHIGGLATLVTCVRYGASMVLFERFDADAVLDAIAPHHCTRMVGLVFMFAEMAARQRERRRDVDTIEFCVSGGDVCPPKLQEMFPDLFGVPLHSLWGASEVGLFLHGLQPGPVTRIPPGFEVRLVDDRGAMVPRGEIGELHVRGPSVTPGYWTGPGRLDDPKSDGWFPTGDLMRRGVADDLWFAARKKDLILRGGSNISPVEVEAVLRANAAVCDVAVVGIPDEVLGQRVGALIELAKNVAGNSLEAILAEARSRLADYKMPERVEIVDRIPRNANGKVDRRAALAMLREALIE
jgi:long-chain acyl-CoA synthetase